MAIPMISMKVNVLSRELVKPCTPTSSNLRTYKISLTDELNPPMNVFRLLYFSSSDESINISLKQSLAQVLPLFYPLAGRYNKEKHLVDCNDEGAEYVEAKVECDLLQLVGPGGIIIPNQLNDLLPLDIGAADDPTDPMLAVQINRFRCGGMAIGVCASHRIFDSCSLGIFLTAWANAAVDGELVIRPDFDSPKWFPGEDLRVVDFDLTMSREKNNDIVAKRFVFDKNAISKLREKVCPEWRSTSGERPPSRVMVVSAALTQAIMRADKARYGNYRELLIAQAINVRERTVPPVSKYACGSWDSLSYIDYSPSDCQRMEYDFRGMVPKMREATMQSIKDCAKILSDKEFGRLIMVDSYFETAKKAASPDVRVTWITDFSKFGEYELDFGFGKPVWVSLANVYLEDLFILMNNKEKDGIEAWVYLHESDMAYFEKDEDLRMLTTQ